MLGALSLSGLVACLHVAGPTDGPLFQTYGREVLGPKLWPGAVVGLDNLSTHKGPAVRTALEAVGARLVYLPPYSPDLNPIEQAWSTFKTALRKAAARATPALHRAMAAGLDAISASDARGYFTHCGYCGSPA